MKPRSGWRRDRGLDGLAARGEADVARWDEQLRDVVGADEVVQRAGRVGERPSVPVFPRRR